MGLIRGWNRFGEDGRDRANSRKNDDVVDGKGAANRSPVAVLATQRFGGIVPQVLGLEAEESPGAIDIVWTPAPIGDLKTYEVHVSTSEAFVEPSIFYVGDTKFTYEDGVASTSYFLRVRAINTGDQTGEWSAPAVEGIPGAIVTDDIEDLSVTTGKLADNAVTNAKMADNSVDSAEIVSGAVDTAHLASEAVHTEDLTYTSGTVTNSGATELQVATENITSVGDEIKIFVGFYYIFNGGTTDGTWTIRIRVGTGGGGSIIYTQDVISDDGTAGARCHYCKIAATPGAGSRTYEATIQQVSGDRDITVGNRTIHLEESHR